MTSLGDPPLHGVAIYNPDLLSKQELVAQFVARRPLLQRLLEDLGREGTNQHHLIVGQRGMGKTTLLRRIRYAIEDDARLSAAWLPLTFPEEQYNVTRLSDLYLNCVDALGDALDRMGRSQEARALDAAVAALPDRDEPERTRRALEVLLHGADLMKRRLLLLIDSVDLVLDRLKGEQWAIRELLSSEPRLRLLGASAVMLETTFQYKEPFYDFFQIHEIGGLSEEETREVLLNLAGAGDMPAIARVVEEDPARIKTFHVLAGGNPRTVVMLYDVLSKGADGDVRADLERLLDRVTPLYKARFEAMPAQSQQVVDALAIHWHPISAAELAMVVRLEVNVVSSQLSRLEKQGVVEKVAYHPSSKAGFQITERFFNIWYLMRASRRVRQRLIWLVEFLRLLYGRTEMRGHAEHTLATILATRDNWLEAEPLARRFLTEGTTDFHDQAWPGILLFFREAARTGHASDAVRLLDDLGLADRWRPLREALAAIAAGSKLPLRRIAPEIRRPAEELLDELWPEGLD